MLSKLINIRALHIVGVTYLESRCESTIANSWELLVKELTHQPNCQNEASIDLLRDSKELTLISTHKYTQYTQMQIFHEPTQKLEKNN